MIIEVRARNCYAFEDDIIFSMKADMRNKKFGANVHKENNFNVLKTIGIYGPNNAGKTCLIKCIRAIRNVLLNKKNGLMPNIFTDSDVCELGVTFMASGRKFSYDFKYDAEKEEYIYESFSEIFKDQYNNEKEVCWLKKDTVSEIYECIDESVQNMISVVSKNNLLCYVVDTSKFEHINEMKQILVGFAEKIDIINMNNIPMQHTIELMKNKNQLQQKVVEFIKNADLYMDNFEYVDMDEYGIDPNELEEKKIDVIHISPSHHFPTGIVMPISRRYELLGWANKVEKHYIIEDDYDSELRLGGKPIPTLQSIDVSDKIIYMNTFTKTLSSTIRMSYMVLPESLADEYYKRLSFYSCTVSNFEQYTLSRFIENGHFERHINRLRNYYLKKQNTILNAFQTSSINNKIEIYNETTGVHFLMKIKSEKAEKDIINNAYSKGIKLSPLSQYYKNNEENNNIYVMNYSSLDSEKIELIVEKLKQCI